jgi:hypothetical protein
LRLKQYIEAIERQLILLTEKVDLLMTQQQDLDTAIAGLGADFTKYQGDVTTLLGSLQTQITALEAQLTALQGSSGIDLTAELASVAGLDSTVKAADAALTPAPATTAPSAS